MSRDPRDAPPDQTKIWAHFQNAGVESFAAARPRLDFLARQLARRCGKHRRVLNIGVGSGHLERTLRARGWDVAALDPDDACIARLAADGVAAQVGVIERLPYPAHDFDAVVASEVLEHLTVPQRAAGIQEIRRVLRPGGWFLGTVPYNEDLQLGLTVCPHCGAQFHRWGHHAAFDEAALRAELVPWFQMAELRHTAFVEFRGRGPLGCLKSLARLLLARAGQPIAVPTLYWAARRSTEPLPLPLAASAAYDPRPAPA